MTSNVDATAASGLEPGGRFAYAPRSGVYDEMLDASGALRPGWRAVADWFRAHSMDELAAHSQRAEVLLLDGFSEPTAGVSPWRLDIAPLALPVAEWSVLESAAIQRMRLYSALLGDLYGAQTLFAQNVLPPETVLRDPRFLRPLHGAQSEAAGLTMLALDFARSPSGGWRVLDAHAETTAGHGYAIANRMVMSEIAGDLFRRAHAERIGSFFLRLAETLAARAQSDDPHIALLAGRPGAPGFAGHAYLARYLGIQRVEGLDLRVVDGRLYFKSIDGLRKVDVLLRGVEGRRCDPLELFPDGFDGPAGMVEASRAAPRLMANSLGASVIENRGLSPFLNAVSQRLLGEELEIYDAPRVWLGQPTEREMVMSNIDAYAVYDAFEGVGRPGQARAAQLGRALNDEERAELLSRAQLDGAAMVAEQPIGVATAPSWTGEALAPAPFALRIFVLNDGESISVMPGGVALNVDSDDAVGLSANEPYARDVWVIGDAPPAPSVSLRRMAAAAAPTHRGAREAPSRVADDLFWLGRYCSRADATLRIVRQALTDFTSDLTRSRDTTRAARALDHLIAKDEAPDTEGPPSLADAVRILCGDQNHSFGLHTTLELLRGTAARNRDRLSHDSWQILSGLTARRLQGLVGTGESGPSTEPPSNASEIIEACDAQLRDLAAFAGLSYENLTRDRGWRFLDLGRRIEQTISLSEVLCALFEHADDPDAERDNLDFILGFADSTITYRSRYRFAPELPLALDLVMIEEINPRSLAYQLARISEHIDAFPLAAEDAVRSPDQRLALDLLTRVRLADIEALSAPDEDGGRPELVSLLRDVASEAPRLSEMISRQYFSHADAAPRRLGAKPIM